MPGRRLAQLEHGHSRGGRCEATAICAGRLPSRSPKTIIATMDSRSRSSFDPARHAPAAHGNAIGARAYSISLWGDEKDGVALHLQAPGIRGNSAAASLRTEQNLGAVEKISSRAGPGRKKACGENFQLLC